MGNVYTVSNGLEVTGDVTISTDSTPQLIFTSADQLNFSSATFPVTAIGYSWQFPAAVTTLVGQDTLDTLTQKTITDFIDTSTTRVTAQTNVSNTTPVAITGLSVALTDKGKYSFRAYLPLTTGAGGIQLAANTTDTLTAASFSATCQVWNVAAITAAGTITTFGNSIVNAAVTGTYAYIDGAISVNNGGAGTFVLTIAQNAAAGTTSALINGYLTMRRIA